MRELTRASLARELDHGTVNGSGRQLAAAVAERDRSTDLRRLDVPALVMHGEKDRVILPSGGVATAAAIPGAELLLVPGMGHDLARWVWPALIERDRAHGEARSFPVLNRPLLDPPEPGRPAQSSRSRSVKVGGPAGLGQVRHTG